MALNYQKDLAALFEGLNSRQKEIIFRRFGLNAKEGETLEAIGQDLGLTRERVRQIVETTLVKIRRESITPEMTKAFSSLRNYLQKSGGLKKEDLLFSDPLFNHQANSRAGINFLLTLGGNFFRSGETKELQAFWALEAQKLSSAQKLIQAIEKKLTKEKKLLSVKDLASLAPGNPAFLKSVLEVSKTVLRTGQDRYGLKAWPEVNPRGVRDLALLVFKKIKKPLHFTEVANSIDEFLSPQKPAEFSVVAAGAAPATRTNFQTVHNELIKDTRFVLVGRGVYALREWGYEPGTVKEVISKVLQEAKQPLSQDEVLKRVLSQRLVKESTILLNLGNKKCFLKSEDGRYSIHEA
ncbi:MAG: hypothetical protein HY577_00755 [Candidatus Nealsonbacteria bacterium]|nr:hypothetical protein [Candidatus Nealsonbacteria bacterium]